MTVPLKRRAICEICYEQMVYSSDPDHEPEYLLQPTNMTTTRFVHKRCLDNAYFVSVELKNMHELNRSLREALQSKVPDHPLLTPQHETKFSNNNS